MDPSTEVIMQIVSRASSPGYEAWWAKVAHAGYCSSPVELRGRDGQGRSVKILTRCKNRHASVCPSCSALYSGDTWQLVHQGISPRDSELLDSRPMVFATLTAPGFGAVHSSSGDGPCRPGKVSRCQHRVSVRCFSVHESDDVRLGEPLCADCYDYLGHVLFTWHAPQLGHRFTVKLRRLVKHHDHTARLSYVKVVELQRRGVPHFHAVIRLDDSAMPTSALVALVHQAAASVRLEVPGFGGELVTLRFGTQTDVQPLMIAVGEGDDRRVASYLAKYVTKSVSDFGLSPRRVSPRAVADLDVRPHVREVLRTVLLLAESPGPPEMARWLHALGYRGHITTKTRTYSTTMGALRAHRAEWRSAQVGVGGDAACVDRDINEWQFIQVGHRNDGERRLALTADAQSRAARLAAREELACGDQFEEG